MSVFGHGQMRLYLLALLREGPRHGYDVIRDLEQRFSGLYSPSAGTVYPRLAKLEEEGLVERTDEGRKALYRLTDAGRAEIRRAQSKRAGGRGRRKARKDRRLHRRGREERRGSTASPAGEDRRSQGGAGRLRWARRGQARGE